jgi:GT2 family glycosyltransferase
MMDRRGVSFVIATRNRREVLLETLAQLQNCGLDPGWMEVFVVDNASSDGTVGAVADRFGGHHVLALTKNLGSCAKSLALREVRFPYVVFLDDDSWPIGDSLPRMLDRFETTPALAAAGFVAHLPDGRMECSALPNVFIGCGVGLRTEVVRSVGGLDEWFFMQAEEYDLAFRIANAGYKVCAFDDLHVRHLKTPQARYRGATAYYDVRNNTVVAFRYLRQPLLGAYLHDWIQRYLWLSRAGGCSGDFARGLAAGLWKAAQDRLSGRYDALLPRPLETFFSLRRIEGHMMQLAGQGVRRILLADLGKNVFAFWRGAMRSGIKLTGIADDRFGSPPGRHYRGTPILPTEVALRGDFQAVVISNTSYVHAADRARQVRQLTDRPVYDWFGRPVNHPV